MRDLIELACTYEIRIDLTNQCLWTFWRLLPSLVDLADPCSFGCQKVDEILANYVASPHSPAYFKTWETKTVAALMPLSIHLCGAAFQYKLHALAMLAHESMETLTQQAYLSILLKSYGGGTGVWVLVTRDNTKSPLMIVCGSRMEIPAERVEHMPSTARTCKDMKKIFQAFQPSERAALRWSQALAAQHSYFALHMRRERLAKSAGTVSLTSPPVVPMAPAVQQSANHDNDTKQDLETYRQRIKEEQQRRSLAIQKQTAPCSKQARAPRARPHRQRKAGIPPMSTDASQEDRKQLSEAAPPSTSVTASTEAPPPLTSSRTINDKDHEEAFALRATSTASLRSVKGRARHRSQTKCAWSQLAGVLETRDIESTERARLEHDLLVRCLASFEQSSSELPASRTEP
jgi:hypothetical protein